MTAPTLPDGKFPDVAYWSFLGGLPDERDVRTGCFPSARLVTWYARRWKPHWPFTLQLVADAEGYTVAELSRELAHEQLALACGRAERVTDHWPSVTRRSERRGQRQKLIAIERFDPYYDESLTPKARAEVLAWFLRWFDRAVLGGMDAELRRWHADALAHVGVRLDDPTAKPLGVDPTYDEDTGLGSERARAVVAAIIDAVNDDVSHARKSSTREAAARVLPILRAYLRGEHRPLQEPDRLYLQRLCERKKIVSPWCRSVA